MIDKILKLSLKDKLVDLFLILALICGLMFIIYFFIKKLNVEKISNDGIVFKNKNSESKFSETIKNENNYNTNKKSILAHRIFKFLQSTKMEGYFNDFNYQFHSFFKCYFDIIYSELLEFFKSIELNDGEGLYEISEIYVNAMNKVNDRCKINNISNDILINSNYKKVIVDEISDIIQDESYMDWYSKAISILDIIHLECKIMLNLNRGEF